MKRSCKVIKTKPIQTRVTVDNPKNAEIMKELFSQYASTPRFCHNMSTRYLVTANGLKLNLEPTVPLLRFKKPDKADFTYYAVLNPSCFGKGDMGGIFEVLGTWKFNAKDKSLQYKLKPQDKTRLIKFVANPDKYFANEYAISQRFLYLSAKYKVDPGSSDNAFLMRKLPGLTMASIIESLNKNPKAVPTKKRFELSIKLLKALAYVHEKEVIHRDIKPENIVVSDDEVFIIDFGLSAQKPLPELQGRSVGTPLFTDPLYLNELIQADEGTDLFSMVMVLAMLWGDTSRDPLQSMDDLKKENENIQLKNLFAGLDDLPQPLQQGLSQLLSQSTRFDREQRPSHKQCLKEIEAIFDEFQHPFKRVISRKQKRKNPLSTANNGMFFMKDARASRIPVDRKNPGQSPS